METVTVLIRRTSREEVGAFLTSRFESQPSGAQWIARVQGDPSLYINEVNGPEHFIPAEEWDRVVQLFGGEPTVCIGADVSGRHVADGQAKAFAIELLRRFDGAVTDGFTEHLWTLHELVTDQVIEGHSFFDVVGWDEDFRGGKADA